MRFTHSIDPDKFCMYRLESFPTGFLTNKWRAEYFQVFVMHRAGYTDVPLYEIRLISPFMPQKEKTEELKGFFFCFKREYLEEDDKEYALDVFNLFNKNVQGTAVFPDHQICSRLERVLLLMREEARDELGTYLVMKALLKVFLLNLIRMRQHAFLDQDILQKRVYEFLILIDAHYQQERLASFYSSKIGLSEKRLNQILAIKMGKTVTQMIHDRLIVEAKRKLISSEQTIKEIAYQLNFKDPAYFTRFFKKQTGLSPEEFKHAVN